MAMAIAGDAEAIAAIYPRVSDVEGFRPMVRWLAGLLADLGWVHIKGPKSRRDAWRVVTEIRAFAAHTYGIDAWTGCLLTRRVALKSLLLKKRS